MVAGDYDQKVIDAQIIKERRYTLTPTGKAAWRKTRDFYVETIPAFSQAVLRQRGRALRVALRTE